MSFLKYMQPERQFTLIWLHNQSGSGRGYSASGSDRWEEVWYFHTNDL